MTFVLECPQCGGVDFTDDENNEQYVCTDETCKCAIPYSEASCYLSHD
jgi:hypothetical protein